MRARAAALAAVALALVACGAKREPGGQRTKREAGGRPQAAGTPPRAHARR